jgi:hypothetical protein
VRARKRGSVPVEEVRKCELTEMDEGKRKGQKERRTYSESLVVGSRKSLNEAVVRVATGELPTCYTTIRNSSRTTGKEGRKEGRNTMTHRMRPRSNLLNTQREETDDTEHEEELAEGGSRVDLVNVGSPHRLDVFVFGDLAGGGVSDGVG